MYPENKPARFLLLVLLLCIPVAIPATLIIPTATTTPSLALVPIRTIPVVPVTTTAAPAAPQVGAVSISSTPSGASVTIDGTIMGATPFTLRTLTVGSHTLVMQMSGYLDYTDTIMIQADQLNQLSYTLTPVPVTTSQPVLAGRQLP